MNISLRHSRYVCHEHVLTRKCIRTDDVVLILITIMSLSCKVYVLVLFSLLTWKQYPRMQSVLSLCCPPYCESWQCPHDVWHICLWLCPHYLYGCVLKKSWISPYVILLMFVTNMSSQVNVYVLIHLTSWLSCPCPHVSKREHMQNIYISCVFSNNVNTYIN